MATLSTSPKGGFRTFNLNDFGDAGGNLSAGNPVATPTSSSSPIAGLPTVISPVGTIVITGDGRETPTTTQEAQDIETSTSEALREELATLGTIRTGIQLAGLFAPTPLGLVLGLGGIAARARIKTVEAELGTRVAPQRPPVARPLAPARPPRSVRDAGPRRDISGRLARNPKAGTPGAPF